MEAHPGRLYFFMNPYTKPAKDINEQINLLEGRGMVFADKDKARHYLAHLNYYRLRGYWIPFEVDTVNHQFKEGITFEKILEIYWFDKKLRLLLLEALEELEISFRTQFAYSLGIQYGANAFMDMNLFKNVRLHEDSQDMLIDYYEKNDQPFIKHLRTKYSDDLPPIWALCEIMSFGQLSKSYSNLKRRQDRNAIAKKYGLDEVVFTSIVHHLSFVRNKCAHYSRIYNSELTVSFTFPMQPSYLAESLNDAAPKKIYNTLTVITYLLEFVGNKDLFIQKISSLFQQQKGITTDFMGFPEDWAETSVWQVSS